ncbi:MAG TPA: hypothetical protein VJM34_16610 [Novosphingobium sp.]|nr:hypothetical protein [Novosphingobium sp.]
MTAPSSRMVAQGGVAEANRHQDEEQADPEDVVHKSLPQRSPQEAA